MASERLLTLSVVTMMALGATTACAGDEGGDGFGVADETGTEGDADDEQSGSDGQSADESDGGETGEGLHEAVLEAMDLFPDYPTLHGEVITRTCTPNQGVCHNQKEYPDLRTPASMLAAVGKRCNLDKDDPADTFDGCEPVGDEVVIDLTPAPAPADPMNPMEPEPVEPVVVHIEIGYVETVLDEEGVAISARVHLREAVPAAMLDGAGMAVSFERSTGSGTLPVGALSLVTWEAGSAVLELGDLSLLSAAELDLIETGLVGGDPNRNGIFGADEPYLEIDPGSPATSYLLQRLQGNVPGSPMPLANQPLSSAEVIALACWIESTGAPGASDDPWLEIDYDDCDFAQNFGGGATSGGHSLADDVQPIFDQSCAYAGCHGSVQPAADLDLTAGNAYDSLMRFSMQNPTQALVEPGNPTNSYLMTKLSDNGVAGVQMPKNGEALDEVSVGIIRQWISEGAAND